MTEPQEADDEARPSWARRLREERLARNWSQRDAVRAMQAHSTEQLASEEALVRKWKRWESAESEPDAYTKPLLAKTLGTVTAALFPAPATRHRDLEVLSSTGMDTLEIVARLRASDINASTLDALRITTDALCSEYPHMPSAQLRIEGHQWLRRITYLLENRLTLDQHREVLSLAGYLAAVGRVRGVRHG